MMMTGTAFAAKRERIARLPAAARGARERVPSRVALGVLLGIGVAIAPRPAKACGSSGPDGVSACSLAAYSEEQRPRWRLGVSGVYTSTVLNFSHSLQVGETRLASLVELSYAPTARLSFTAGIGVAVGGRILAPDGPHDFSRGFVSTLGASYRLASGRTPIGQGFISLGLVLSYTDSDTELVSPGPSTPYNALDLRASFAAGLTWFRVFSAYGVVRGFGGPVYWTYAGESVTGTDSHHYQVGGGLALLVAKRIDLFAEGVPLGEQAVSAGAALAF